MFLCFYSNVIIREYISQKNLPNLPVGVPMFFLNPVDVVWVHACMAGGFDAEHGTIYSRAFVK
jgi:hypothetical protein